jgi:hypothetical protein
VSGREDRDDVIATEFGEWLEVARGMLAAGYPEAEESAVEDAASVAAHLADVLGKLERGASPGPPDWRWLSQAADACGLVNPGQPGRRRTRGERPGANTTGGAGVILDHLNTEACPRCGELLMWHQHFVQVPYRGDVISVPRCPTDEEVERLRPSLVL